ncbi:recombinase family protein [Flavobacterium sp. W22_SRS_FP1]|uniref:recombinase family protein n=1 Tax=Flavobacterium sp. W22_SRS_FP1 TaxID=3240276 RepID=UPI003F92A872
MKNVILYVRVSTDEQAGRGYSLRDQEQKLINYCQTNNLNILEIFREDYSAKTFKRPEFKKLLDYCKKNKKEVHQLIFIKWDRFSRNTGESYQMISVFNELAIEVNAIEQPLDLSIPEQGLMLAVYLSIPQVENHRRSLNIISGMRRAFKEGRYVGSAPKGYENGKDSAKKPLLIPGKSAKLVQEAFELMSTGLYNQIEVMKKLNKKGLSTTKTPFSNLLKNPIYYGGVPIKAYKDEKACIANGIHEPLISKALFDQVQDILNNRRKKHHTNHKKLNDTYPLKGFLLCPKCNNALTGSTSKGRSKYYSYYHCVSPCNSRYLLEDVNLWIGDYLKTISMEAPVKKIFEDKIKEALYNERDKKQLGAKHYEKVINIEAKLQRLQDIYIDGDIDKTEYQIAKTRYENILSELKDKESEAINEKEVFELYKNATEKIKNIGNQYIQSNIEDKRRIIGSIFPNNFQFENKKVRTADMNPYLIKIASINGASRGKKKRDKSKKIDLSHTVMDNLSLSAEERFEKFCIKYPTLLQKVPQKQIASYIGVTPEFFSKMKSKLLKR